MCKLTLERDGCALLTKYKDNKKRDENDYIRKILTQMRYYSFSRINLIIYPLF